MRTAAVLVHSDSLCIHPLSGIYDAPVLTAPRRALAMLLAGGTLFAGGCGDSSDVPAVGARELIRSELVWPERDRRQVGLERLDTRRLDGPCQAPPNSDVQRRRVVTRIDSVMHRVLGPDWGGTWNAGCKAERLKFGVPRGAGGRRVAAEVRRAREVLRDRQLDDITDLVAVPVSLRSLARAQDAFDVVARDGALGSRPEPSLNAVVVEVARSVDSDGWRRLRKTARRTGVNIVLVRLDKSKSGLVG